MTPSMLFETAVSLVLQVTLLAAFTWLVDRSSGSARQSAVIWTRTFVAVLCLALCAFLLPHFRWFRLPSHAELATSGSVLQFQIVSVKLMLIIWLIGFATGVLCRMHRCISLLHFLVVRCRQMSELQLAALPADVIALAPRQTRWLLSDKVHGPFCWQMQRPTVVLPASLLELDRQVLRHVLLHELEHLAAKHPMQHFLQGICNTMMWFHPAIRLAARRAEIMREYWCDEVAAQCREGVPRYLRSLAIVSEQSAQTPAYTLGISDRGNSIVLRSNRLARLLKKKAWHPATNVGPLRTNAATTLIILAALLLSQLWLPVNLLASKHHWLSPWPSWTASVLHDVGWTVRDFEPFDHRQEAHEFLNPDD